MEINAIIFISRIVSDQIWKVPVISLNNVELKVNSGTNGWKSAPFVDSQEQIIFISVAEKWYVLRARQFDVTQK